MSTFLEALFIVFAVMGTIIVGVLGTAYFVDMKSCSGFGAGTGMETRYEFGCYVKVNDKWIPKEYVYGNVNEIRIETKP